MAQGKKINVSFEVSEGEALALAQFVKRVGFAEWRQNAIDETEAYLMKDAFYKLQNGLADSGFSPR